MSLLRWLSVCTLVFSVANVSFADTKDTDLNVETVVRSELIPQTWSYECSEKLDEYYGSPCVLKNESNRIVFAHLSKSIHVMQGTLPEFLRYKKGDNDGICRLLYVQPKPLMYNGPKGYIVDSDWITAGSLGKVDSTYCLAPK